MEMTQAFFAAVWAISQEMAPWLLLGALISALLHVAVPKGFIKRHLGGGRLASICKASVLGIPLPLCSCSVIPTALALHKEGARKGASLSFLISTPQTGVDSLAVTGAMLGWPFAVFKMGAALLMGVAGGLFVSEKHELQDQQSQRAVVPADEQQPAWWRACTFGVSVLQALWFWLALGVVVSALITVLVPAGSLSDQVWAQGWWAYVGVLFIALPLYVCATASVPIAAALVLAGFPSGAALIFLMAGPATNMATIGAVKRSLGKVCLLIYLGVMVVGSVLAALLFDGMIGMTLGDELLLDHHSHEEHNHWFSQLCAGALLLAMLYWAVQALRQRFFGAAAGACCDGPSSSSSAASVSCCSPAVSATSCCDSDKPAEPSAQSEASGSSCCSGHS